jgi:hypothetical protein
VQWTAGMGKYELEDQDPFEVGMITEKLPKLEEELPWEDGIEPELELPLGELPSIIIDEAA